MQKYVCLVDLVKRFPTLFQRVFACEIGVSKKDWTNLLACLLASIQPRRSPSKFGGKFNSLFIRLLRRHPRALRYNDNNLILNHALAYAGLKRRGSGNRCLKGDTLYPKKKQTTGQLWQVFNLSTNLTVTFAKLVNLQKMWQTLTNI